MEEQAKRNMQMFQDSMKMFTPFGGTAQGFANPFGATAGRNDAVPPETVKPQAPKDDLQVLREQMAAMQRKLDDMNK
jgi:polyhydroxyalkanoate synthesis regulator protein